MTRIAVRIGSVAAPRGRGFDAADLCARVEQELRELIASDPLSSLPPAGETISVPGGRLPALAYPAAAAHAIACRVHECLRAGEAAP